MNVDSRPYGRGPAALRHRPSPFLRAAVRRAPARPNPALPILSAEDDRQTRLGVSDHNDLRVLRQRQLFGRFDALPFEELGADSRGDDALEVGDAARFDALA